MIFVYEIELIFSKVADCYLRMQFFYANSIYLTFKKLCVVYVIENIIYEQVSEKNKIMRENPNDLCFAQHIDIQTNASERKSQIPNNLFKNNNQNHQCTT